jgi:hypothetical protein
MDHREAKRALVRLRRAIEKAGFELESVAGALRQVEAGDFPAADFDGAADRLREIAAFVEEQAERLDDKILHAGGLEPGRVRRTGGG